MPFIFAVCNLNEVPLITRLDAIARMCCAPMNAEYAYEILGALCEELSERVGKDGVGDVSLVVYVDKLFLLISENDDKYGYLLEKIVCNTSIPITMRYAFVVQSKTLVDNEKFFKKMCFVILDLNENGIEKFQIMTCSNLIAYPESLLSEEFQNLVDKLFQWGENSMLSENIRADALDVVLTHGYDDNDRTSARSMLMALGEQGAGILSSIYNNSQNAHLESVGASVEHVMRKLDERLEITTLSFDEICERLKEMNDSASLNFSLYRIQYQIGSVVGGKTLMDVFMKLYGFIEFHQYRVDLEQRLVEELVDMEDTCATGYYERLLLVLTGYADFSLTVSFQEQIQANLIGRLNAVIRDSEQLDLVLEELTDEDFIRRPELLKIFQKNIARIREELQAEFVDDAVGGVSDELRERSDDAVGGVKCLICI